MAYKNWGAVCGMLCMSTFFSYSMEDECKEDGQRELNWSMQFAAAEGKLERVKELVAKGAPINPNYRTGHPAPPGGPTLNLNTHHHDGMESYETQPLCEAIIKGRTKVVEWLVENNADVNARSGSCGEPPLERAAACGHSGLVDYLVERNAHVDGGDNFRITPLMSAASRGSLEIVCNLLKLYGADAHLRDSMGKSALWYLFEGGSCGGWSDARGLILHTLLAKKVDPNVQSMRKKAPLHFAASMNLEACQLLVEAKAEVNVRDDDKWTPLHRAAYRYEKRRDRSVYDYLVACGADEHAQGHWSGTPAERMKKLSGK